MNRSLIASLGIASIFAVGGCTPAAAGPGWTFAPGGSSAVSTATPTATPAPTAATPAPPSPTAAPTPKPTPVLGTTEAPRVITVSMGNFFYEPTSVKVRQGETIRFVVENPATIMHELVLGTAEEQEHHAMEMAERMGDGHMDDQHGAAEPSDLELQPGETGELVWTFEEAGEVLMGCHVAGHWEAGMKGTIDVSGA